jgi:hypothetical protein
MALSVLAYNLTGVMNTLQCRGQLDVDVAGIFNFDSPLHYTATIPPRGGWQVR